MRALLIGIMICIGFTARAQVSLILEGYGAKRMMELHIGEDMIYKLEGDKLWSHAVITGLDLETGRVFFEHGSIEIDQVTKIMKVGRKQSMRKFSNILYLFGAQWLGYSAVWSAIRDDYDFQKRDVLIPAGAAGIASLLRLFSGNRKYTVGKAKKLRIRDLRWTLPEVS